MSKPIKRLIRDELTQRFDGLTSLAVVGFTGLGAIDTNNIRRQLREKDIFLTVVKNSMARAAFKDAGLEAAGDLLDGPSAIAYGGDNIVSVVRELLSFRKTAPALTVKAAILEGDIFGEDRIDELSKYPTREEAIGKVISAALGAGGKVVNCLTAPGGALAGILKTIEENQEGDSTEAA